MAKAAQPRRKHVPQRTCVVCRNGRGKRELVRVVRTAGSGVQVDLTGKVAGRGAYLCRSRPCWLQALSSRRLDAALKTVITVEEKGALQAFAVTLPDASADEA